MRVRGPAALLLLALAPGAARASPPDEKPFPATDRSIILREEKTIYLVEGRVKIPRGVEVSCQKEIYIRAKGDAPAVIEVAGSFKAHGVSNREIIFEGVTVEPAETFDKIQLDSCVFRKGGGLATPKDGSSTGILYLQFCAFQDGARMDLALTGPSVDLIDSSLSGTLRLRGVDPGGKPNRLKATLRAFDTGGIQAENVADLTYRLGVIRAGPAQFKDCETLTFDGNKVEAKEISFLQSKAGGFARTQVLKCDLYSKRIVFRAPADPKRDDAVALDKCWFEGLTASAAIAERIVDVADEKDNNVRATPTNPQERPLELAGHVNR